MLSKTLKKPGESCSARVGAAMAPGLGEGGRFLLSFLTGLFLRGRLKEAEAKTGDGGKPREASASVDGFDFMDGV